MWLCQGKVCVKDNKVDALQLASGNLINDCELLVSRRSLNKVSGINQVWSEKKDTYIHIQ